MLILNAGYSVNLTLSAALSTVALSTRNAVKVEAVSGLGLSPGVIATIGTTQTLGPYPSGVIKLTATGGDCSYDVQPVSTTAAYATDASGNVTGLVGPDSAVLQLGKNPEFYNLSSKTLRKWRAALARARNGGAVARIACLGDSTVRGAWANGTSGTNVIPKSWPTYLAKAFTAAGYKGSSESWFGGGNFGVALSTIDARITMSGGWGSTSGVQSLGGVMPKTIAAGVLAFTPSVARTSYDIYVPRNYLGSMNMDIGGVGTTLIDEGPAMSVFKATITGGSSTLSPLNLTWVSGQALVIGIEGKDPSDVVSVMNMGSSGAKASDIAAVTSSPWDPVQALPIVAPDLTIISLTINDWVAGTDVTAYKASVQSLITAGLQSGDVMLLTGAPSNTANASAAAQAAIVAAYYQLANTNGIALLDITSRFASYATSQPLGLYGDTSLHPSGVGYSDIASALASAIVAP